MSQVLFRVGDATFSQREDGLLVEQSGEQYLAVSWKLTREFKDTVEMFFNHGLTCVIRKTHPMPKNRVTGVDYVGFSRCSEERWVAVADQYSGRPKINRLTIEKGYRDILSSAKFPFAWETAGGQNIFIERVELPNLLTLLNDGVIAEVERLRKAGPRTRERLSYPILVSEAQLQALVGQELREKRFRKVFGTFKWMVEHPRWGREIIGPRPQASDIPDILVFSESTMFIVELKLNEVNTQALHQVANYAANPESLRLADGRRIEAVLIGHRVSASLKQRELDEIGQHVPIRVLTYTTASETPLELASAMQSRMTQDA